MTEDLGANSTRKQKKRELLNLEDFVRFMKRDLDCIAFLGECTGQGQLVVKANGMRTNINCYLDWVEKQREETDDSPRPNH